MVVAFLLVLFGAVLIFLDAVGAHLLGSVSQAWVGVSLAFLGIALGTFWPGSHRIP